MQPAVRDLYKRLLVVSKDYPKGIDWCRTRLKKAFTNTPVNSEADLQTALTKGNYIIDEMVAVIQFRKYREMKRRYGQRVSRVEGDDFYSTIAESLPASSVVHDG